MLRINKIYAMDCLEGMKLLDDESIDLIATDPPYNIGKDFANDNLTKEDFILWCEKWVVEMDRVLKWGGAIYICLGWQCVAELKMLFDKCDSLRLKNWIVWYRQDGWKGDKGFAHSHEHILYFIKDLENHPNKKIFAEDVYNRRKIKKISTLEARKLIGMKVYKNCGNAGKLWFETGRLPNKEQYNGLIKTLNISRHFGNFINWRFNKIDVCDDVWLNPKSEKKRLGHPTQKPEALFRRIIKASSNEGDLILDPFIGSGTTIIACKQLNRNFIGFELSKEYCKIADERLKQSGLSSF